MIRDRLAQFGQPFDRAVPVIGEIDLQMVAARRSAVEDADLGLALAEVGPRGIAHAVADLHRLFVDADHAHEGQLSKGAHWFCDTRHLNLTLKTRLAGTVPMLSGRRRRPPW